MPYTPRLTLANRWSEVGHCFERWSPESQARLRNVKSQLGAQLQGHLSGRCAHVKGWGGVKGAVRRTQALTDRFAFVARLDIRGYYDNIDHAVLLAQLQQAAVSAELRALVADYLGMPDAHRTGRGMVAGGAISPLLAALYLTPLDRQMQSHEKRHGIAYQRYMDDFVIFAPTRHKLRAGLRAMYRVLASLKLSVHPDKRYIGTTRKGFDFLGYRLHPGRKLRPSGQSLDRLLLRARRLHEQGAGQNRLRQYVERWFAWLHGGLHGRVKTNGRLHRIWNIVWTWLQRSLPHTTPS